MAGNSRVPSARIPGTRPKSDNRRELDGAVVSERQGDDPKPAEEIKVPGPRAIHVINQTRPNK